jgi:uncharacterized protein (TIGR03118 family)
MRRGQKHCWLALLLALCGFAGVARGAEGYRQTNLVSDIPGLAPVTDPNLVNPWGLAVGVLFGTIPTFLWVADNATGVSTLYDGSGNPAPPPPQTPLVVIIPPAGNGTIAAPTGIVLNGTGQFLVSEGGLSGSAFFIFASEDGGISGWNPTVNPTRAILAVDNSGSGAIYKGLALASSGGANFLYATNFHAGTVDMFDSSFAPAGSFTDPNPDLAGFAPFGIQAIGSQLYVTYAKQDKAKEDDVKGPGLGFVDVFNTDGTFAKRLVSNGTLNAPWGLALAPADFGDFSNDLLVGNFGDGRISAFDPTSGEFQGLLRETNGSAIKIKGLWALVFGSGDPSGNGGPANSLFFTAGIAGEHHGLFGTLTVAESNQ